MSPGPRHLGGISRRAVLAAVPLLLPAQTPTKGMLFPSDWARYPDPSTEFEVLRLTDPGYQSLLASAPARSITANSGELLYASTRSGSLQVHLMRLRDGRSRMLTNAGALRAGAQTLTHDDRAILFFDGAELIYSALSGLREQGVARLREGFEWEAGPVTSPDGLSYYLVEAGGGASELRRIKRPSNAIETIASDQRGILNPSPNPRRAMICWRNRDGELYTSTIDGQQRRKVETPPGKVLQACWSPDGQSLSYLFEPAETGQLISIREQNLDARTDTLIAKTSQYVVFAPNADASVFLGCSRSKANPSVLIMLRLTRRELILCDHASADPSATAPLFAPNSQRIFYQSDRHGRPAIYAVQVERLIEKTGT